MPLMTMAWDDEVAVLGVGCCVCARAYSFRSLVRVLVAGRFLVIFGEFSRLGLTSSFFTVVDRF